MLKKILAYLICGITIFVILYEGVYKYPRWNKGRSEAVIAWDVSGYYMYLPAFLIYKDPEGKSFADSIIAKYHPASDVYDQAMVAPNGKYVMKYSSGLSFLYLPWFCIAHFAAEHFSYPQDGFSFPYQLMIALGCMLYGFIGLYYLRCVLVTYYEELVVALTLFCIAVCSNYLPYASADAANIHVPVFMLYSLVIYNTLKWYDTKLVKNVFCIGLFTGWAALCRPNDIFIALIPILWNTRFSINSFREKLQVWSLYKTQIAFAAIITIAVGGIQLFYWKHFTGHFLYYSYGDEKFQFLNPHIWSCLFSFRKGWWLYSPIMLLVIPGFYFLKKDTRPVFLLPLVFFLAYAYVVFSWQTWWYGGGFGQRALIQSYTLLAFPIAAFFTYIINASQVWKFFSFLFVAGCFMLNLIFMYQSHDVFPWECGDMTAKYYIKIFGKTSVPLETTFFLDHDEEYKGDIGNLKMCYQNSFDNITHDNKDSSVYLSNPFSMACNSFPDLKPVVTVPVKQLSGDVEYLRISGMFRATEREWSVWNMRQFMVRLYRKEQVIKQKFIRPQRALDNQDWKSAWLDLEVPRGGFDSLSICFQGGNLYIPLYLDDLKIYCITR